MNNLPIINSHQVRLPTLNMWAGNSTEYFNNDIATSEQHLLNALNSDKTYTSYERKRILCDLVAGDIIKDFKCYSDDTYNINLGKNSAGKNEIVTVKYMNEKLVVIKPESKKLFLSRPINIHNCETTKPAEHKEVASRSKFFAATKMGVINKSKNYVTQDMFKQIILCKLTTKEDLEKNKANIANYLTTLLLNGEIIKGFEITQDGRFKVCPQVNTVRVLKDGHIETVSSYFFIDIEKLLETKKNNEQVMLNQVQVPLIQEAKQMVPVNKISPACIIERDSYRFEYDHIADRVGLVPNYFKQEYELLGKLQPEPSKNIQEINLPGGRYSGNTLNNVPHGYGTWDIEEYKLRGVWDKGELQPNVLLGQGNRIEKVIWVKSVEKPYYEFNNISISEVPIEYYHNKIKNSIEEISSRPVSMPVAYENEIDEVIKYFRGEIRHVVQ